jgi:hypothetical protein
MTDEKKPMEVVFAPGCFDSFDGTQEELDEMVAEIQAMFTNMTPDELASRSQPVDIDSLLENGDEELLEQLMSQLDQDQKRKLQ